MSNDSGIYVASFPVTFPISEREEDRWEYRVIHTTNIEDTEYKDSVTAFVTDLYRVVMWVDAKVFTSEDAVKQHATDLYWKLTNDGHEPEYGLGSYHYDDPLLKLTKEEALVKLEWYWKTERLMK